jgi:hypothetical protein
LSGRTVNGQPTITTARTPIAKKVFVIVLGRIEVRASPRNVPLSTSRRATFEPFLFISFCIACLGLNSRVGPKFADGIQREVPATVLVRQASPKKNACCSRHHPANDFTTASRPRTEWRRRRDSNPRDPFRSNGFQDRRFQPLTHSSAFNSSAVAQTFYGLDLLQEGKTKLNHSNPTTEPQPFHAEHTAFP